MTTILTAPSEINKVGMDLLARPAGSLPDAHKSFAATYCAYQRKIQQYHDHPSLPLRKQIESMVDELILLYIRHFYSGAPLH